MEAVGPGHVLEVHEGAFAGDEGGDVLGAGDFRGGGAAIEPEVSDFGREAVIHRLFAGDGGRQNQCGVDGRRDVPGGGEGLNAFDFRCVRVDGDEVEAAVAPRAEHGS